MFSRLLQEARPPMERKKVSEENALKERVKELERLAFQIHCLHEEDRWAVSSALHDKVLQILNVAHLNAEKFLKGEHKEGKVCVEERIVRELRDQIAEAIERSQDLMHELSSPVLRYLGLAAALKWVAERHALSGRMSIKVEDKGDNTRTLPDDLKSLAFLAVRELFRGIEKTGEIDSLEVAVWSSSSEIAVDLGGFDTSRLQKAWQTCLPARLSCVKEQCRALGGEIFVTIDAGKGGENSVKLRIPIPQSSDTQNE